MSAADCERLHELGSEVALGIADGEDRAWALDHLAGCPECRARIERLSSLADQLLLISPLAEPPAGFEARVVDAVAPARSARRPLWRRLALPVAAAAVAASIAAGVVWVAGANDRDLADSYRDTLAVAHGEYFDAAPIVLPGGSPVGYVYGYQGRTSWVLAIVYDGLPKGRYDLEGVTDDGRTVPLRSMDVAGGHGSTGGATPVDYDHLVRVRVLNDAGREVAGSDLRE